MDSNKSVLGVEMGIQNFAGVLGIVVLCQINIIVVLVLHTKEMAISFAHRSLVILSSVGVVRRICFIAEEFVEELHTGLVGHHTYFTRVVVVGLSRSNLDLLN